jgi:hypothetical protein
MQEPAAKIAGLMAVKNYSDACSAFSTLRALSDFTIILDDNSDRQFPYREECGEYLNLRRRGLWNDLGNKLTLLQRAYVNGCTWVVCMDDDILFSHNFQTKADVLKLIGEAEASGRDTCLFLLRDLWDSSESFRCDGVWGAKHFMVLRKNWFFYEDITLPRAGLKRLHREVYPAGFAARPGSNRLVCPQYCAYHTGCISSERRIERVRKYSVEDPNNEHQADYTYMLETEQLSLAPVPEDDLRLIRQKLRLGKGGSV